MGFGKPNKEYLHQAFSKIYEQLHVIETVLGSEHEDDIETVRLSVEELSNKIK